jgi:hypothetical protein
MRNVNKTDILVTKWKLFATKRKTTPGQPDAILNRHALGLNKQYWNICPKKAKIHIFDRKPRPNVYK